MTIDISKLGINRVVRILSGPYAGKCGRIVASNWHTVEVQIPTRLTDSLIVTNTVTVEWEAIKFV